jgi:hypothetical protein
MNKDAEGLYIEKRAAAELKDEEEAAKRKIAEINKQINADVKKSRLERYHEALNAHVMARLKELKEKKEEKKEKEKEKREMKQIDKMLGQARKCEKKERAKLEEK